MSEAQAYPLQWPAGRKRTPIANRKSATFRAGRRSVSIADGVKRLMAEISSFTRTGKPWVIDPNTVVVSTNVPTRGVVPYSNASEPQDGGVAVYFRLRGKSHCVSCDRWNRVADNIAAIAKHLEAMRGMERWGVADVEAVFAGFKALPGGDSPSIVTPLAMTVEDAARFIARTAAPGGDGGEYVARSVIQSADVYSKLYRAATMNVHPDRTGGVEKPEWHTLQRAAAVLDKHHTAVAV